MIDSRRPPRGDKNPPTHRALLLSLAAFDTERKTQIHQGQGVRQAKTMATNPEEAQKASASTYQARTASMAGMATSTFEDEDTDDEAGG